MLRDCKNGPTIWPEFFTQKGQKSGLQQCECGGRALKLNPTLPMVNLSKVKDFAVKVSQRQFKKKTNNGSQKCNHDSHIIEASNQRALLLS